MIREHSVRFKITAACCVCSENRKHLVGIKSACTVSCVNNNLKALERMLVIFCINFLFNLLAKSLCVVAHIVNIRNISAVAFFGMFTVLCIEKNFLNVTALKTALTGEKFKTVSVERVVTCGNLKSTVTSEVNGCHKH